MAITTPVAFYKLSDTSDATGNGFTLTNNGTTTFSAGLIGNAANFGTSNSSKYLSIASSYGITGSFSVSLWVKISTEIASGAYYFFDLVDTTTQVRYVLFYNYNAGSPQIGIDRVKLGVSDNVVTWSSGFLGTAAWHHIVVTFDGSTLTLYGDGSSRGTPLSTSGNGVGSAISAAAFGCERFGDPTVFLSGLIDVAGIWNVGLSSAEVTELWNSGAGNEFPFSTAVFTKNLIGSKMAVKRASTY